MPAANFAPYVQALQWDGTNVTEMRQFVRNSGGAITEAGIRNGVLFLTPNIPDTLIGGLEPIEVPVNNWVVISLGNVLSLTPTDFAARYKLLP